jgi:predicted SPOUT superfamily RNA methylase MTH1
MDEQAEPSRKKRKEEGRLLKKQKIDEAGGVRPRVAPAPAPAAPSSRHSAPKRSLLHHGKHRFGRVMDAVPCRNRPRHSTLSIAIPGSVISNCQTRELKTQFVGQIARAATIYHVDEIIVFDDKLAKEHKPRPFSGGNRRPHRETPREAPPREKEEDDRETKNTEGGETQRNEDRPSVNKRDPHTFMARVLQYCECPQYLRRHFFPMHPDLQFSGLLAPVDAPHHVRAEDRCKYREGVVLEKTGPSKGSLVNCGIRGRPVE